MELYLIRHTTPKIDLSTCYGQSDIDITSTFAQEATIIHQKLCGFVPDTIYSSPLKRCSLLAFELFPTHPPKLLDELKEINFGDWEMKPWHSIPQNELMVWSDDFWNICPPKGESFRVFHDRVRRFMISLTNSHQNDKVAVITHSGVFRALMMDWLGMPHTHIFNLKLDFGAVVHVVKKGESLSIQFL